MLALPLAPCATDNPNAVSATSSGGTNVSGSGSRGGGGGSGGSWVVDKMGSWVDPRDVVRAGGGSHLHAVGDGGAKRACSAGAGVDTVHIVALDTALISVGRATAFPTPVRLTSLCTDLTAAFQRVGASCIHIRWNVNLV